MALPSINDLPQYKGKLLNDSDWGLLLQTLINFLTTGYDLNVNQITASTYIGVPTTQVSGSLAGEALSKGDVCYIKTSDSKIYKADNSGVSTSDTLLGIAVDDYSSGDSVTLETSLYSQFTGLTVGVYYLGSSGGILATPPLSAIVKPLGIAVSPTTMKLFNNPSQAIFLAGIDSLTIGDLLIDANTISSGSGDINITPNSGNDIVLDGHWEFDGPLLTALTDNNTTINAYTGKNITIESVTIDGGVVGGVSTLDSSGVITAGGGVVAGTGNATLLTKVINIGDWNMDAATSVSLAHGLTFSKIRAVDILIRNDDDTGLYPLCSFLSTDGAGIPGGYYLDATNINLLRNSGTAFDSVNFNATSFNRGFITITYIA